ncbi:Met-10+ like-protein-domain-containing protein [Spinellus fusiger]|nr:Met-10+ like-protein-domain-containing protein [Spinellus fusiger]
MQVLNRAAFAKSYEICGLRVPAKRVGSVMSVLGNQLLNQPRLRNVTDDKESKDTKVVLLRADLCQENLDTLPEQVKKVVEKEGLGFITHKIDLDYDYWTSEQILHAVMPEDAKEIPSSYTQTGHIAHMNLREEHYPWKKLVGEVVLDKNKNITCVVNKTDSIEATYRYFKMELLAGDGNMIAVVKESGCKFKFDFSKVYWNSRLHTEHERLVHQFKPKDYVCDVFAGVGPFALPATKRGATVYANDLNPCSYEWLNKNIELNKITEGIYTYNMDGREFIRKATQDLQKTSTQWKTFDHFILNLPATAIEFLASDVFYGLYSDQKDLFNTTENATLPTIHCHCFTKSTEPKEDIAQASIRHMSESMGVPLDMALAQFHCVRNVAPRKDMYCVSFPLSPQVAFAATSKRRNHDVAEPTTVQKPRLD